MYYVDLALNGLIFGCMYALMAVGLTLVYGLLRILHIAHAAVYAFGAFITVVVANATGSIAFGILVAIAASAILGIGIYRLLYQPLLDHPPYVAMIASMGLLVFMEDGFRIVFGEQGLTFARNPYPTQVYELFGLTINTVQIAMLVVATALPHRAEPVHHPDPDRNRLAGDGVEPEDRHQLRRRRDQGALSEFPDRLGARGARRRADRAAEQFRRADNGLRRQLQGAGDHRPGRARQRARHADRELRARHRRVVRNDLRRHAISTATPSRFCSSSSS